MVNVAATPTVPVMISPVLCPNRMVWGGEKQPPSVGNLSMVISTVWVRGASLGKLHTEVHSTRVPGDPQRLTLAETVDGVAVGNGG